MKTRSTLFGLLLGFGLLLLAGAAPESALAQCCAPPPPCCVPPPAPPCCVAPPAPPPPSPPCCQAPRNPSVNVHVSNVSVAVANARAGSGAAAAAGAAAVFYGGGGGGGGYVPPMSTGVVQLNVEGGRKMKRTAYEASRTGTRRVVIQAVCIDARQIPHPASQVRPDREIGDQYEGELYRCIAGTWLQATVADYLDKVDFSGGKTLACAKGDALYHTRGGKVECRRQTAARDCNERSLLRRFGAGIKILTIVETEKYTAYREEEERSETYATGAMSLDGGVGGSVY